MLRTLPLALLLLFPFAASATVPLPVVGPGCDDDDGDGFVDVPGDCPNDFVRCTHITNETQCWEENACSWDAERSLCLGSDWELISYVPARWRNRMKEPVELALGSGMSADRAWQRTTGRHDVIVAVMDSGIKWDEHDLQNKHFLNRGELPRPQTAEGLATAGRSDADNPACPSADAYDHNRDCVFNVQDYADDPRVEGDDSTPVDYLFSRCHYPFNNASALIAVEAPNAILEPADLLCVFSDGVDDDANGYVDDISGWDHLWDDNNAYDDPRFGHGTGEGKDSTAEANNGGGLPGVCPNCVLLSVRVGDSFVVDANNWATGMIFAIDSGARVLQSAVGAITHTELSQAAIEYAYARGIIDIVSAADETAQHQNYPGAVDHAEYVHAVRYDAESINQATTWLNFSNCTNYGARLVLSAAATGCSSGATGMSSGAGGLIASAALEARVTLSGAELHQIYVNAVDDIDLPTSQPGHPQHDDKRYPSKAGWDMFFGYGRLNVSKAVDLIFDGRIPPEADVASPAWWTVLDPTAGVVPVRGVARAPRSTLTEWVLEYGVGVEPDDTEPVDPSVWHFIAGGTTPVDGVLGTFDPAGVPFDPRARLERYNTRADRGPVDDNVTKARKLNRYTVTLRLRVADAAGNLAEDRQAIYVHRDDTWKPGFPIQLGVSGGSSPKLYDLDGDGDLEILLGDDAGRVHAFTAAATELPGWPVQTRPGRVVRHPASRAFTHGPDGLPGTGDEIEDEVASAVLATVAIGDLDANGVPDVVAATLDGEIYAWDASGNIRPGFPRNSDGHTTGPDTSVDAATELGIFATPALADLDGDGTLEIIVATLDQQLLALHADGDPVNGFPVSGARDPSDLTKPFLRLPYEGNDDGQIRRIVSSPAVGDLDADGDLEIVVGTNEAINDQISVVHAITFNKSANRPEAYRADCGQSGARKRCFPILMVGGYPNALPYVGEGSPASPVLADLDGDGTLEIGATSIADFGRLYHHDGFDSFDPSGSAFRELKSFFGYYGVDTNSDQASSLVMINSGSFGDLDGDCVLDYFMGAAGSNFVDNLLRDGERADFDHQLAAWSTDDGEMLQGFPQVMEDLQFFLNPLVADVDGDGGAEVINTSATFAIHAFKADGTEPLGWPKFTGQWQIASPAVGDIDGDGLLEMAAVTRAGYLFVYELEGPADGNVQWPTFRHDAANTGNFHTADATVARPRCGVKEEDEGCGCGASTSTLAVLAGLALLRRRRR
jgi:hypothetical protein